MFAAAGDHSPTLVLALLVAIAGGIGAVLRALVIHHVARRRSDPLPLGTIVVNASGSLVLGVFTGLSLYHGLGPHELSVAGVGLCGGYTTWSTASWAKLLALRAPSGTRRARRLYAGLMRLTRIGDGGQLGPPACSPPSPRPAQHHRQTFAVLVAPRATWMVLPGILNT